MSRWLVLLLFLPSIAAAQTPENNARMEKLLANAKRMTAVDADGCLKSWDANEIVVCGIPEIDRKQRLPFPALAINPEKRVREPIPKANPEIVQQGRCYVTMNERNCFKGLPLMTVSFGGSGGGLAGPVGRLWRFVEPAVPDEDYVKQVQDRSNGDDGR